MSVPRPSGSRNAIKFEYYRGGSLKLTTWIKILEKQDGKKPRISNVVRKLRQKEEDTWNGKKPASIVEKFDSLAISQMKENDSEQAIISLTKQEENELLVQACDGSQIGRDFALGEQGKAMIRTTTLDLVKHQQVQQHLHFQALILHKLLELQGDSTPISNS